MSFKIDGIGQMMDELRLLGEPDELAPKMLEAAEPILTRNLMAGLANHRRSGDLVGSVKATKPKKGKEAWSLTVRPTGTDRKGVRNQEKLAYLEYGVKAHNQPATPVLSPAVRQSEAACLDAMQRVFDEATK